MLSDKTRRSLSLLDAANCLGAILCTLLLTVFLLTRVWAAVPATGTLTASGPNVSWVGDEPATGAIGAGVSNENGCVDSGAARNCDTFTLTIGGNPADYKGKLVTVSVSWTVLADEYDLFLHQGNVSGPLVASSQSGLGGDGSANTSNTNAVTIDPTNPATPPGVYTVHVASVVGSPADQYRGAASVSVNPIPVPRLASYTYGGFRFTPDIALRAPTTTSDGEPSSRTDIHGNVYISGIRGVPAGVDLWYFDLNPNSPTYDPLMRNPLYRGQPDGFTNNGVNAGGTAAAGGDGGGDIDLAVGFGDTLNALGQPTGPPTLAYASLLAANISTGNTKDTGKTFTYNPVGNSSGGISADDREWLEFYGASSVYLLYRTLNPAISQIQRSDDGGLTYRVAATAGLIGQSGAIDVDQADGTVYVSGSTGVVGVGHPPIDPTTGKPSTILPPATYTTYQAASDPNGVAHLFFQVAVAQDAGMGPGQNGKPYGTVYCLYSNDNDVFLEYSLDQAKTWSKPVKVNGPALMGPSLGGPDAVVKANIFPRMALGKSSGSVGVVWYGSTDNGTTNDPATNTPLAAKGSPNALWKVYYALTRNAISDTPAFQESAASNHVIHAGNVSEGGLVLTGTNPNRNLLDYFEVSFDPLGAAVIAYTDDHNDFSGNCFATRQDGGTAVDGSTLTPPRGPIPAPSPAPASPPKIPTPDGAQVTDFAQDQTSGLAAKTPTNSPVDILAVKYYSVRTPGGPAIVAAMRVSDLTLPHPSSTWRMYFTVNAPFANLLDPSNSFSLAANDLGDNFYLQATTDAQGNATYGYGTAYRDVSGTLQRNALSGSAQGVLDTSTNRIIVQVPVSFLNTILAAKKRPLIVSGTYLTGLLGSASGPESGLVLADDTNGGANYRLP